MGVLSINPNDKLFIITLVMMLTICFTPTHCSRHTQKETDKRLGKERSFSNILQSIKN